MQLNSEATQAEEDVLGNAIKEGCEVSFNKIYDKYKPRMIGMAMKYIDDRVLADDIVSMIFLKVWEKSHQWDDTRGHFVAWIYVLAKHTIIDVLRIDKSDIEVPFIMADEKALTAVEIGELVSSETPEHSIGDVMFTEIVEKLLSNVSNNKYKQSWSLFHLHGYSIGQIADKLQITDTAVKLRSHRCSLEMRRIITLNPDYYM